MSINNRLIIQNRKDGRKEGPGRLITNMGVIYQGNFHQNELHGNGKIIFPSLNLQIGLMAVAKHNSFLINKTYIYIGEFNQGNIEGTGKFVSYKNIKTVGTFKDGKLDGEDCKMYYPEGHVYTGDVSRGRHHGKGNIIIFKIFIKDNYCFYFLLIVVI